MLLRTLQSKRSVSKPMSRITREGVRDIRRLVISGSLRVRVVAVAIGAETGFSSPQTSCRMLPGRGAPVRELIGVKRKSDSRRSGLVSWGAEERRVV